MGQVNKMDGRMPCVMTNCKVKNDGYMAVFSVTSGGDAGGIVGLTNDGTISSCFNYGTANIQTSFGGGSCKQIASAVFGTIITDVYCTVPTNAGSSLTSGTMTDAINTLPVTEPLIWELRSGASYPTLINNPE